jgi:hypothetical protein
MGQETPAAVVKGDRGLVTAGLEAEDEHRSGSGSFAKTGARG